MATATNEPVCENCGCPVSEHEPIKAGPDGHTGGECWTPGCRCTHLVVRTAEAALRRVTED